MRTIEYKAVFSGTIVRLPGGTPSLVANPNEELIRVTARNINSGYTKALKRALEPLGNGNRRELIRIEFWQVL